MWTDAMGSSAVKYLNGGAHILRAVYGESRQVARTAVKQASQCRYSWVVVGCRVVESRDVGECWMVMRGKKVGAREKAQMIFQNTIVNR
jgi:hypothetical protein